MRTADLTLSVCLERKRILLTRLVVKYLGNPSHLSFWYDEANGCLIISAASRDDLDAYEIPRHYWEGTKHSCEVARFAFLRALQYRLGWEDGSRYLIKGSFVQSRDMRAAVFDLTGGTRIR